MGSPRIVQSMDFIDRPGFWIEDNVFSDAECDDLINAVPQSLQRRSRAGARHLMLIPTIKAAAKDERLLQIARLALGESAIPFRATLFDKSAGANWLVAWHQDTALPLESRNDAMGLGPWTVKMGILYAHAPAWALSRVIALRISLDASTSENGPLRIIPGSHLGGALNDDEIHELARTREIVEALVPRGGVLAMRPLLVHSSSKSRGVEPRRVLHIEYADDLDLRPGLRLAIA
ncbi:MAG: phytanoyl-CoA dioxygenase family protein [Chloracidobacterium sp.]|nr:phytanoyl-CoA dioxygenase family protein [Chloracidobacterium sp.]